MKKEMPKCNVTCQFAKFGRCSIGIMSPGPDCNFRNYKMKLVKVYLKNIGDPVANYA